MTRCFVLLLMLAGCAETPPVYRPVEVPMPVALTCHAPKIGPPALPATPANADLAAKIRSLLVELDLRKAYEARLSAALGACE